MTENACRQNNIAYFPKLNRLWFAEIVIATEDIGPFHQP